MDAFICHVSNIADKITSNIWFLVAFNIALAVVWVLFGLESANILISIITAEMVLLAAGANRRGQKALHVKLDALIKAGKPADDFIGAEKKLEKEIDRLGDKI